MKQSGRINNILVYKQHGGCGPSILQSSDDDNKEIIPWHFRYCWILLADPRPRQTSFPLPLVTNQGDRSGSLAVNKCLNGSNTDRRVV